MCCNFHIYKIRQESKENYWKRSVEKNIIKERSERDRFERDSFLFNGIVLEQKRVRLLHFTQIQWSRIIVTVHWGEQFFLQSLKLDIQIELVDETGRSDETGLGGRLGTVLAGARTGGLESGILLLTLVFWSVFWCSGDDYFLVWWRWVVLLATNVTHINIFIINFNYR